jgi:putative aldouronate transport system substrate-binding protein
MKKKKWLALGLAATMGLSLLAGCGNDKADTDTNADANADTKESDNGEQSDTAGDIPTLKWIQVGNEKPVNYDAWLAQINPYLEEKIGANVDVEVVPWGDWQNRRSVIINAGEEFDILFTNQERYNAEVNTGAFLDISEMVKTVTPDLFGMIPEAYWQASSIDGKVYAVPTYKDSAVTNYFIWDKAIADKYKIDITTIDNYDKLYEALKAVKEGEGGSPYVMSKSGAEFLATTFFDQLGAGLLPLGIRYDDNTKKVVNPMEDESILKIMDVVYKMYQEGIINGDAPQAEDNNKYRTFFTAQGWSGAAKTTWGPNNGIDNCEAVQYDKTVVSNTSVRGSLNAISSGSKYPEKALELLQLVNTDTKVRDWLYYGVEGENFEYTTDNKINRLNNDWAMAGYTQGTFFNVSQLATDEFNQWDEVQELNTQAVSSVMLGFDMDTSKVETELANCRAVYEKYKSEFWTGAQDPRALIENIKSELETAGWETIRKEAQAQVDAAQ